MRRLVVIGGGGHGRVVADAAEAAQPARAIVFLDDRFPALSCVDSWEVIGTALGGDRSLGHDDEVVVAVGDGTTRLRILQQFADAGLALANVVHPSAAVSRRASLGPGATVLAGACINTGARLGRGVIVNTGATVDHDCVLLDGVHVSPGAHLGGAVRVGRRSWIGIGASVRHCIAIGDDVIVGAGAAVVSTISDGAVVVGVPARARDRDDL